MPEVTQPMHETLKSRFSVFQGGGLGWGAEKGARSLPPLLSVSAVKARPWSPSAQHLQKDFFTSFWKTGLSGITALIFPPSLGFSFLLPTCLPTCLLIKI